jgi:hypothetical protein
LNISILNKNEKTIKNYSLRKTKYNWIFCVYFIRK